VRRIFEAEGWRKLHMMSFITCIPEVKDEMGKKCSTHESEEEYIQCIAWKTKRKTTTRKTGT
jgi:hypothetical protein